MNNNKNFKELESVLTSLRQKEYPIPVEIMTLGDIRRKLLREPTDESGNKISLKDDKGNDLPYSRYSLINKKTDVIDEILTKFPLAFDNQTDRGVPWAMHGRAIIDSYFKSVSDGSHTGVIEILDINANIKSLEKFKKTEDGIPLIAELDDEIKYWKKQARYGHNYFAIIGKNRINYAIPLKIEDLLREGIDLDTARYKFQFRIYKSYMTRAFKSKLYINEKSNVKDNMIQYLIGYDGEYSRFLHTTTHQEQKRANISKFYSVSALINYQDREDLLNVISIPLDKYADATWQEKQFKENQSLTNEQKRLGREWIDYFDVYGQLVNGSNANYKKVFKDRKSPTYKGAVAFILHRLKQKQNDQNYTVMGDAEDRMKNIIDATELAWSSLCETANSGVIYMKRHDDTTLTFKGLISGFKKNDGFRHKNYAPLDPSDLDNANKQDTQRNVVNHLMWEKVNSYLEENELYKKVVRRDFTKDDLHHLIQRDRIGNTKYVKARYNGEVERQLSKLIKKFSVEKPNDKYVMGQFDGGYILDDEYVALEISVILGDDVWVDHIVSYSDNTGEKDLGKVEFTTKKFNGWKSSDPLTNQDEVIARLKEATDRMK